MTKCAANEIVQRSILSFLQSHIANLKEDSIDEIVLSYIVSVVEEMTASELAERSEDAFDIEAIQEMLEAVLPEVEAIPQTAIIDWLFQVAEELKTQEKSEAKVEISLKKFIDMSASSTSTKKRTPKSSESDMTIENVSGKNSKRITRWSETSDGSSETSAEGEEVQQVLDQLQEMFPNACSLEVNHCLLLAAGDIEKAAQLILFRYESGQSLKPTEKKPFRGNKLDDKAVKERILGKYGFVDKDDDNRYHRPMLKTDNDKKMIRYRDGKIVSTKGERFTQVSKQESEEMKKALVNMIN